ncbi:hypothetical protein [Ekhidna sp. To15]|uniref:hypothetical protein n=1 Tax=Ekhidna sp. To15 TaxID=3395267 RepID=UPI003F52318B
MNKPAKTVWLFGLYLIVEGLFLMLAPSWVLSGIGLPDPESVWRLILGFVVAVLGYYYVRNANENLIPFFGFTVQIRIIQFVFFIWLYVFDRGTLSLVAFSFIEFAAGMWTWRMLKRSSSH